MSRNEKTGLALLTETLEIYGADRTRWPAQLRRDLSKIVTESADAQRLFREAEALDKLLDRAPALNQKQLDALALRIAAASRSVPRIAVLNEKPLRPPAALEPRRWIMPATTLAASLMIGLLAGQSAAVGPAIGQLTGIGATGTAVEYSGSGQTALLPDGFDTDFDEELL